MSIDLDTEVASILRSHAAEARVSEGEIVDRAIRAYDPRLLIARVRDRSDLDLVGVAKPRWLQASACACGP